MAKPKKKGKKQEVVGSKSPFVGKKRLARYSRGLDRLEKRLGRKYNPYDVVKDAKDPESPLHDYFDWDIETAAQKHWLHQARQLIATVVVKMIDYRGRPVPARKWVNTTLLEGEEPEQTYVSHTRVRSTPSLMHNYLSNELRSLEAWFHRNRTYRDLKPILKFLEGAIPKARMDLLGEMPDDKKPKGKKPKGKKKN